jgi:hypothetical protein
MVSVERLRSSKISGSFSSRIMSVPWARAGSAVYGSDLSWPHLSANTVF